MLIRTLSRRVLPAAAVFALLGGALVAQDRVSPSSDAVAEPAVVTEHAVPTSQERTVQKRRSAEEHDPTAKVEELEQGHLVAELPKTSMKDFSLVGVTWTKGLQADPADTLVEVRTRSTKGTWTRWQEIHIEPGESGRPGTEPLWVGSSDAVALRVLSSSDADVEGLSLATVDPGRSLETTPVAASVGQPSIILRSGWGARANTSCDSPRYGDATLGAVIHHTAGSNSYSKSDSASLVRGVQSYHMKSRGWCDIGYNFLVDKYGQIFEGRNGGITKPVRAAHSGNDAVNQETMGVSLMGEFSSSSPSAAMKTATANLVAWRFAQAGLPAKGTYKLGGKTLNRIAGHRNVVSTACPGAKAYAWLSASGGLRDTVEGLLDGAASVPAPTGVKVTDYGTTSLGLAWTAVSGAAKYQVKISKSSDMSDATYVESTSPSATVSDLSPFTNYYYRVGVLDADGTRVSPYTGSPYSTTTGSGLKSTGSTSSSVDVSWSASPGAASYQLKISKSSSMSSATYKELKGTSGTLTGLSADTTYYVKIGALDSSGKRTTSLAAPPTMISTGDTTSPTTPTGLKSTGATASTIDLAWSAVEGAAKYQVKLSKSSSMSSAKYFTFSTNSGTATGLSASTTYYAKVAVLDKNGERITSYAAAPVAVKTTAAGTSSGSTTPTGLKSTASTTSTLDLAWSAVSGAAKYQVKLSRSSSMSSAKYFTFSKNSGTATGLSASTTYYGKVAVLDKNGKRITSYSGTPATLATAAKASSAKDTTSVPSSRTIAFKGHGYGHGIGMSQYGAEGGARDGAKYTEILDKYYTGTDLGSKSGDIRVLITADTSDSVLIEAKSGIVFRQGGTEITLPTTVGGDKVVRWMIVQRSSNKKQSVLQYRTTGGYTTYKSMVWTGNAQFEASSLTLVTPAGNRVYRDTLRSALPSSGSSARNTVNVLSLENYTRGVVAREMPSSWHAEALKAQSVAARTYGARTMGSGGYYDICDTTSCQVYGGVSAETDATDAAIKATAGKILTYDGKPALAQFSSSSGGYTNTGSQPYLKAVSDGWDGWSGNKNHDWTISVKASTIEKKYSSIGTLKSLSVTKRNGHGEDGGRVSSLKLVGSKGSKTITGVDARWAFGLRSDWFAF